MANTDDGAISSDFDDSGDDDGNVRNLCIYPSLVRVSKGCDVGLLMLADETSNFHADDWRSMCKMIDRQIDEAACPRGARVLKGCDADLLMTEDEAAYVSPDLWCRTVDEHFDEAASFVFSIEGELGHHLCGLPPAVCVYKDESGPQIMRRWDLLDRLTRNREKAIETAHAALEFFAPKTFDGRRSRTYSRFTSAWKVCTIGDAARRIAQRSNTTRQRWNERTSTSLNIARSFEPT